MSNRIVSTGKLDISESSKQHLAVIAFNQGKRNLMSIRIKSEQAAERAERMFNQFVRVGSVVKLSRMHAQNFINQF